MAGGGTALLLHNQEVGVPVIATLSFAQGAASGAREVDPVTGELGQVLNDVPGIDGVFGLALDAGDARLIVLQ